MQAQVSPAAIALMALMKLKGVGRRAALKLVEADDAGLSLTELRARLFEKARLARMDLGLLADAWSGCADLAEEGIDHGIGAMAFHDRDYPARLRTISDPPAVLFIKGALSALTGRSVAIVGTREPTPYGGQVALRSGRAAVEAGFVVVSGLAHGCDTYGHRGCLDAQGVGVAVLAHGLDRVYPAANRDLAAELVEQGGCLVSEYPVGMTPMRTAFAERDRIQSGLSDGVLVIETDVKGGTMHTVRFARDQKRPLACIAHPLRWLGEDKTQGNQMLIADKWARPIADGDDLAAFLATLGSSDAAKGDTPEVPAEVPTEATAKQLGWVF